MAVDEPAKPTHAVIYLSNLNERVRIPHLKETLTRLFRNYGKVLDVTAHKNMRMRGQAFVTLDHPAKAAKAIRELQRLPLYGKALQLTFARNESDAFVKKTRPADLDAHKAERLAHKKATRYTNPVALRFKAKHAAQATGTAEVTAAPRRVIQLPDEYQAPNKILFLQNLPDDASKDALELMFKSYPEFVEVRVISGRKGIAFVEYTDEASSAVAKEALHNMRFGDSEDSPKMKVTFARS